MPPWDAVQVLRVMADCESATDSSGGDGGEGVGEGGSEEQGKDEGEREGPVAVAMHWGTFVTDPAEVLRTLGGLEWACRMQGVGFGRELEKGAKGKPRFVAVNHGGSVCL